MATYEFGSGALWGTRTDLTVQTPVNFGLVQDVALDFSFDLKELYGQYKFPVAIAQGKGKCSGKAKLARISGLVFGGLFFGINPVAGQLATIFAEGPTAVPVTPFTITVANGATWVDDLGVINAITGLPLTKVASAPVAGQYSVSAGGVYLFSSADNVSGVTVLINYTYTISATGTKILVVNQLMGTTPTFSANFYTTFQNKPVTVKLPNCVCGKLGHASKLDDFTIPEMDFQIFADAAGNVATWSFSEAA